MHSKPNTPFRSAFARARTFMRFGILLLLAIMIRSTPAQSTDLDQARKEGEAVLYTTMVVSDFQIFQKALAKKYPFFRVNHVRLGGAAQASRAIADLNLLLQPRSKVSSPRIWRSQKLLIRHHHGLTSHRG